MDFSVKYFQITDIRQSANVVRTANKQQIRIRSLFISLLNVFLKKILASQKKLNCPRLSQPVAIGYDW